MAWLTHFLLHLCYKDSIEILYNILQNTQKELKRHCTNPCWKSVVPFLFAKKGGGNKMTWKDLLCIVTLVSIVLDVIAFIITYLIQ